MLWFLASGKWRKKDEKVMNLLCYRGTLGTQNPVSQYNKSKWNKWETISLEFLCMYILALTWVPHLWLTLDLWMKVYKACLLYRSFFFNHCALDIFCKYKFLYILFFFPLLVNMVKWQISIHTFFLGETEIFGFYVKILVVKGMRNNTRLRGKEFAFICLWSLCFNFFRGIWDEKTVFWKLASLPPCRLENSPFPINSFANSPVKQVTLVLITCSWWVTEKMLLPHFITTAFSWAWFRDLCEGSEMERKGLKMRRAWGSELPRKAPGQRTDFEATPVSWTQQCDLRTQSLSRIVYLLT